MSLFKPLCKYTATVTCVRDIVPTLREAIKQAQSGTPGKLDSTNLFLSTQTPSYLMNLLSMRLAEAIGDSRNYV